MRSRIVGSMSAASLMGVGVGLVVGVASGLLMAPMRGSQMRASLRSRADEALNRGRALLEEGRRALQTNWGSMTHDAETTALTAPLGEIAQMHSGTTPGSFGGRS